MANDSYRLPVGYRFYWDEECRFCNTMKALGEKLDWGRLVTFLPLQSDPALIDLGHMDFEEMMASSHLVTPEGRVLSRGEGILGLANLLPLMKPAVFVFRLIPQHHLLADKMYRYVASRRGVPYGGSCKVDLSE